MSTAAVFLDRDGTLVKHYDYLTHPDQVELLPCTVSALRLLKERGYALIVVTNQSAVARGMITEETLLAVHDRLKALLAEQGAYVDQIYYCPFHPDGAIEQYRRESDLRKPAPGMLLQAAGELDLDLGRSWMIGDESRDIAAGQAAGCRTIRLDASAPSAQAKTHSIAPDFRAVNLQEAANMVIRYGAGAASEPETPQPIAHEVPPDAVAESSVVGARSAAQPALAQDVPAGEPIAAEASPPDPTPTDDPALGPVEKKRIKKKKPRPDAATNDLLAQILRELKTSNRESRFTEFSVSKLLAGLIQMVVLLCLMLAFWFRSGEQPNLEATRDCLLLGMILQTMVVTLLVMHRQ